MPITTEKDEETEISKELRNKLKRYDVRVKEYRMLKNSFATETDENYLIRMAINNNITKNNTQGKFDDAIEQYECLATFIASEERKSPLETLKSLNRTKLKKFSGQGYTHVIIQTCGDGGCIECRNKNGMSIEIPTALKTMPLPNAKCKFDLYRNGYTFCRCDYKPTYGARYKKKEGILTPEIKQIIKFIGLLIPLLLIIYFFFLKPD